MGPAPFNDAELPELASHKLVAVIVKVASKVPVTGASAEAGAAPEYRLITLEPCVMLPRLGVIEAAPPQISANLSAYEKFYFFNVPKFFQTHSLITDNTSGIEVPETEVQDIDTEKDWQLAELKYIFTFHPHLISSSLKIKS